jgi:uncharacterized protein
MTGKKRALLLLGGTWHDFDGFAGAFSPVLENRGWSVEASYDLERLTRLDQENFDLVLTYTCFTTPTEGVKPTGAEKMEDAQIDALAAWVSAGGAYLAAHASTALGDSNPTLGKLIGGVFIEHPPMFSFTVYPVYGNHPIIAGIPAFTVYDEMYIERCDESVRVHLVTIKDGVAHPLAWSKTEGRGRVAHVALGHSAEVWELEPYQQLMIQAVDWLTCTETG